VASIGALVDKGRVCEDLLEDFEAVTWAEDDAELGPSEALAAEMALTRVAWASTSATPSPASTSASQYKALVD
jgi:hypothetical protein